jgi:hypothetical protein
MATSSQAGTRTETRDQYSLATILGIWALATIPMGLLSWVVYPAVSPDFASDPLGAGVTRIALLTVGLIWLFALSLIIVRREEGDLRWTTVKRRLRLNAPRDGMTGEIRRKLWLWVIPFLVASVVWDMGLKSCVNDVFGRDLPLSRRASRLRIRGASWLEGDSGTTRGCLVVLWTDPGIRRLQYDPW